MLSLAESVVLHDTDSEIRGLPVRSLTVYVTEVPAEGDAVGVHISVLIDANTGRWPWILTRDLHIRPEDDLDAILTSHYPDVHAARLPGVFASDELKQLLCVVINAVLYATSSPEWPLLASPANAALRRVANRGKKKQAGAATRANELRRTHSGEDIWHLPGRIPISMVRALGDLSRTGDGRALFARFMVRGHWRRAPEGWRDRRARWIEPYWKGPELGPVVEHEYRLKP